MTEENQNPEETKNLPAPVKPFIPIKNGQLVPQDAAGLFYLASMMSKTSMVPDQYRGDPHSTFVAIQLGMEVGLRPMQALQNIAVIKGKPTIYADGITGLLHGSGKCEFINEWFEVKGERYDTSDLPLDLSEWPDGLKAVSEIKRHGSAQQLYRGTFSVSDAKRMGTWNSKEVWKKHPARMLMWRARTYAARDGFSDVLKGLGVFEEVVDYDADLENQNGHYGVPEEVVKPVEGDVIEPETEKDISQFEEMCIDNKIDHKVALEYCKHIHDITGAPILTITIKATQNPAGFVEKFKKWVDPTDDGDPMGIDEPELPPEVENQTGNLDESPFQDPPAPEIGQDGFSADIDPDKKAEVEARTADRGDGVMNTSSGHPKKVDQSAEGEGGHRDARPDETSAPADHPPAPKSTIKKWIGLRGVDFKDYVPANPEDFEGIPIAEYKRAREKWDQIVKPRYEISWPLGSAEKESAIEFPNQNVKQRFAEIKKEHPEEVQKSLDKFRMAKGGLSEDAMELVIKDVLEVFGGEVIQK